MQSVRFSRSVPRVASERIPLSEKRPNARRWPTRGVNVMPGFVPFLFSFRLAFSPQHKATEKILRPQTAVGRCEPFSAHERGGSATFVGLSKKKISREGKVKETNAIVRHFAVFFFYRKLAGFRL